MSDFYGVCKAIADLPGLSPAERAQADRTAAAALEADVAVANLAVAAHDAAGLLRNFMSALLAADFRIALDEAEKVAAHPDLAELNVQMDGWYGE